MIKTRRYQLKKEAERIVLSGHPWVFKSHLSSAADVFASGDWLCLVNSTNETIGYGIYEKDALIAIRVFKLGKTPPSALWVKERLKKALQKREHLKNYTEAFRALHGENDGLPGIVFDVYGRVGVLQTYASSVDPLGRYVAQVLGAELKLRSVIWKVPTRRKKKGGETRVLWGHAPTLQTLKEGKLQIAVDIGEGQKSGTFLDLRGLRKYVASQRLNGKRVLNLFSYTGTLGLAAEVAGAEEVTEVDISQGALEFAKKHHSLSVKKHRYIAADVFRWAESLGAHEKYDLIIVDPPSMASLSEQVPAALKAYARIYRLMLPHLLPTGCMIVCCCTSRITREKFQEVAARTLGTQLKCIKSLQPEDDHPVAYPQGDYLKMLVFGAK